MEINHEHEPSIEAEVQTGSSVEIRHLTEPRIIEESPSELRVEAIVQELGDLSSIPRGLSSGRKKDRESNRRRIDSLSIIIPALNEEQYLPKLLRSLVRQEFQGKLQVVVVDENSEDRTVEAARKFEDRLPIEVVSSERGIGHQRNVGADLARYPHILFLDSDVIVPKGMLNKFTSVIDPEERIVDTIVLLPYPQKFVDTVGAMYANGILALINKVEPAMTGAFLLTTKSNHERVGGFAEKAIIGEDLDYVLRSARDGARTHKHLRFYVLSSSRRGDDMGRLKFALAWGKACLYVRRNGPIFEGFHYPYGHYKK